MHESKNVRKSSKIKKNFIFFGKKIMNFLSAMVNGGMIPFEEIDSRLEKIGKNRGWLAEISGRKINSVRVALAPNAHEKNRSTLLQRVLSEAIEAEETRQNVALAEMRGQNLVIEVERDQFRAWNAAALASGQLIEDWAVTGLDRLASQSEHRDKKASEAA